MVISKRALRCNYMWIMTEASEGSEQTKHWRGKPLFTNNRLPLQRFVSSEASDAPGL